MAVTIGSQLGSYEITALLGKGGFGEVYRAKDKQLKREVAIEILPDEFSSNHDRPRFRSARAFTAEPR
jgi:serine/threonine-protein kinase